MGDNASLGRMVIRPQDAFRTETTFIDRMGDNASLTRQTFSTERYSQEYNLTALPSEGVRGGAVAYS
jgi:hypothetical protein